MDIIEVKKKLIGYAVWEIDPVTARGHILNLAITESERRKGYGRLLLKHVLANLRESGMSSCFLEVRESNTPARRLYESQGCTESGRLDDYYFDEDAIEYLCDL